MKQSNKSSLARFWNRLPVWVRSIVSGFLVSTLGIAVWTAVLSLLPTSLAVIIMLIPLWLFWKYFSGRIGPKKSRETRSNLFRSLALPPRVWKYGLAGAMLFVLIVQSSFVVTFRMVEMPPGYATGYAILETLPRWLAWAALIMSSVVAGICEETGYRGYLQVPLEKRYGQVIAILVSSVIFTLIHLIKVWAAPIVPNIFLASILLGILAYRTRSLIPGIIGHSILDIFDYSFWWTNLLGKWNRPTIFRTGPDIHFIGWCLIFTLGVLGFYWVMLRLGARPLGLPRGLKEKIPENKFC